MGNAYTMLRINDGTHLNNNVVIFSHQRRKKALKCSRLFCQHQDQDQDFYLKTKTKTKTREFVLEVPRDQDLGLEDYITDD